MTTTNSLVYYLADKQTLERIGDTVYGDVRQCYAAFQLLPDNEKANCNIFAGVTYDTDEESE